MPLLLFHGSAGNSAMTAAHRKEGNVYLDRVEVLIHS
jgi:hypothetical protein